MALIYLGLGSNVGESRHILHKARIYLGIFLGYIQDASSLYESEPWGIQDQRAFINQVLVVDSVVTIDQVYRVTSHIEQVLKKEKDSKYGPRNIDIDILLYDDEIYSAPSLEIPHPRMLERNFVLIPLAEIAETVIYPGSKMTIAALKGTCKDQGMVKKISE